jgi:hypothetical protein
VWKKRIPKCIGNCSTEIQPQCTKAPTEKGLQNSSLTKENQNRPTTYQFGFSKFQPFT